MAGARGWAHREGLDRPPEETGMLCEARAAADGSTIKFSAEGE